MVSTGYTGRDDGVRSRAHILLEDLLSGLYGEGFKLKKWDGRCGIKFSAFFLPKILTRTLSQTIPIVDRLRRVIAILAGRPKDDQWREHMQQGAEALEDARQQGSFSPSAGSHRRGDFFCLRSGLSHGGGQTRPTNVANGATNQRILDRLSKMDCFRRIGAFATCTWSLKILMY